MKKPLFSQFLSRETSPSSGESGKNGRQYLAEALESRILYSAAPADVAPVEEVAHVVPAEVEQNVDGYFSGTAEFEAAALPIQTGTLDKVAAGEAVTLSSLDNLTDEDLATLADAAERRWAESGLSAEQLAILGQIEYHIVELEGPVLGYAEGSHIYIDDDAAQYGWFVDATPWEDSEFTGSTIGQVEGIDLLSVTAHEIGHILGLADQTVETAEGSPDIMHGFFEEGERRLINAGRAEGAEALSLEGRHYATAWDGGGVDNNWNTADNWDTDTVPTSGDVLTVGSPANVLLGQSTFSTLTIDDGASVQMDVNPVSTNTINVNGVLTKDATVMRLEGATVNIGSTGSIGSGITFLDTNNATMTFVDGAAFDNPSMNFEHKGTNVFNFELGASGFTTIQAGGFFLGGGATIADATYNVDMVAYTGGSQVITLMDFASAGAMDDATFQGAGGLNILNAPAGATTSLRWNDTNEAIELVVSLPITFDNGSGDSLWTNATNWGPDGVPTGADAVVVNSPFNVLSPETNTAYAFSSLTIDDGASVELDANPNSTNTINVNGVLTKDNDVMRLGGATVNIGSTGSIGSGITFLDTNNATMTFDSGAAFDNPTMNFEHKGTNVFNFNLEASGFTTIQAGTLFLATSPATTIADATYNVDMAAYTGGSQVITLMDFTSAGMDDATFQGAGGLNILNAPAGATTSLRWNDTDESIELVVTVPASPGVTLSKTTATVGEDGTADSFTVVLDAAPASDVVISITNPDTGEVTADKSELTFTSGNWNVAQTVNLTGADDNLGDGDQLTTLTLSVVDGSSDAAYHSVLDQTVVVTTSDNEVVVDWDGGGAGDLWVTAANWTNDTLPASGNIVDISNGDTVDWDASSGDNLPGSLSISLTGNSTLTASGTLRLNGATINVASGSALTGNGFWDLNNGTINFENGAGATMSNWEHKGTNIFTFELGSAGFTPLTPGTLRSSGAVSTTYQVDMASYAGGAGVITLVDFGSDATNLTNAVFTEGVQYTLSVLNQGANSAVLQWNETDKAIELVVSAPNSAPTIDDIANQTIDEDAITLVTLPLSFTIGDSETAAGSLIVTATSDNQDLIPNANLVLGGSDANRTLTVMPNADANTAANGTATITVTVDDGTVTTQDTFTVTVNALDDGPDFTVSGDIVVNEDNGNTDNNAAYTFNGHLAYSDGGPDDESAQTQVGDFEIANLQAVNDSGLFQSIGVTGGNLTFTTVGNANGFVDVTVRATDSGSATGDNENTTAKTFRITVNPVNDNPSFNLGSDASTDTSDLPFALRSFQELLTLAAPDATSIVIKSFPTPSGQSTPNGDLEYNSSQVSNGQEIPATNVGNLIFSPDTTANSTWSGTFSFTFQIRNADGTLSSEFTYSHRSSQSAPLRGDVSVSTNGGDGPVTVDGFAAVDFGDVDPANLRFDVISRFPQGLFIQEPSVSLDGTLRFIPEPGAIGSSVVTLELTDGSRSFGQQSFLINLLEGVAPLPGGNSFIGQLRPETGIFDSFLRNEGADLREILLPVGTGSDLSGTGDNLDPLIVVSVLTGTNGTGGMATFLAFSEIASTREWLESGEEKAGDSPVFRLFDIEAVGNTDSQIPGGKREMPQVEETNDEPFIPEGDEESNHEVEDPERPGVATGKAPNQESNNVEPPTRL